MKKDDLLVSRSKLLKAAKSNKYKQARNKARIVYILEKELTEEEIKKYNEIMAIEGNLFEKFKSSQIKRSILRYYSSYFTEEEYKFYYEKICVENDKKIKKI